MTEGAEQGQLSRVYGFEGQDQVDGGGLDLETSLGQLDRSLLFPTPRHVWLQSRDRPSRNNQGRTRPQIDQHRDPARQRREAGQHPLCQRMV